jgi:hypothetical protein
VNEQEERSGVHRYCSTPGTGTTGYLKKKSKYIINTVLIFSCWCVFTLVHGRKKYEGTKYQFSLLEGK